MKNTICTAVGIVGGYIASLYGGWDMVLEVLMWLMALDYAMGLVVAGLFHNSPKSSTGGLESRAGWKGLARKGATMVVVLVGHEMDLLLGIQYIRDATAIAFCVNEAISIIENADLMGLPIPAILVDAIDQLKKRGENDHD